MPQTRDEATDVWHVRHDVVGVDDVGRAAFGGERGGQRLTEELRDRVDAAAAGHLGDVGGRLDAEHRHARRDVVLQQVPVVAGDLETREAAPSPRSRTRRVTSVRACATISSELDEKDV